jgi:hypothetical protein
VVVVRREVRKRAVVGRSFMVVECWVYSTVVVDFGDVVGIGLRVGVAERIAMVDWFCMYTLELGYIDVVVYSD